MGLKNRKTRKYRGSRTCGGGGVKKRRGAGHRGGRGNAGKKKHRKSWYLTNDPSALILKGPGRPSVPGDVPRAINVGSLENRVDELIASGVAERKARKIHLHLSEIGYDKLLGGGLVKNAWVITAAASSEIASRKITEAGGQVMTGDPTSEAEAST